MGGSKHTGVDGNFLTPADALDAALLQEAEQLDLDRQGYFPDLIQEQGATRGAFNPALALHVRNTVLDAAAEGARYGSLADTGLDAGAARTRDLLVAALGPAFATEVTATYASDDGYPTVRMRVVTPLPLLGLLGPDRSLEVIGRAVVEGSG